MYLNLKLGNHSVQATESFCLSSSCVPYVLSSLDCPFLVATSVFSNVYLDSSRCSNSPHLLPEN
jgi:hypothetical protein